MLTQTSTTSFASFTAEKAHHVRSSRSRDKLSESERAERAERKKSVQGGGSTERKLRRRTTIERLRDHADNFTKIIVKNAIPTVVSSNVQSAPSPPTRRHTTTSIVTFKETTSVPDQSPLTQLGTDVHKLHVPSGCDTKSNGGGKSAGVTFDLGEKTADTLDTMQPATQREDAAETGPRRLSARGSSDTGPSKDPASKGMVQRFVRMVSQNQERSGVSGGMLSKLAHSASVVFGNVLMNSYDSEGEQSEFQPRYKPGGLEHLCRITKFTKKEIQLLYRGFKEGCPTGTVDLDKFKAIYQQFFPQGDCTRYANYVFNTFDTDRSGSITFDEFCIGLSIITRGTNKEKMGWVFKLYDTDEDGILTRDDLLRIISSVYDMIGKYTAPAWDERKVWSHVDYIFNKMDTNLDGQITLDEFHETINTDKRIMQSLDLFKTNF